MSFPFWSKSLPSAEVMFQNLKTQQLNITIDNYGNSVLERNYPDDYFSCDHLSNHFTEYERINCQFGTYTTPAKMWHVLKKDAKKLPLLEQRELVYSSTKECNTFNVTFCLWIINTLVGSDAIILDPSSGWGDRLIAALASGAKIYDGFDPNTNLQKGYKKIIKTFNSSKETKASVKALPFEEANIRKDYDLALTSPPYFDLEKYGNDSKQSIIKNPLYETWLSEFYEPYLIKMLHAVKSEGFIVVYIENVTSNGIRYNMRDFTIKTINESGLTKNHTRFGLKVGKAVRYALVWQKK